LTNASSGACSSRCDRICRHADGSARCLVSTDWMTPHGPHCLRAGRAERVRIPALSSARVFEWAAIRYAKQSRSTASRARSKSAHSSAQARTAAPACRSFASSSLPRPRLRPELTPATSAATARSLNAADGVARSSPHAALPSGNAAPAPVRTAASKAGTPGPRRTRAPAAIPAARCARPLPR